MIRVDKPQRRSATARTLDRLRRDSGSKKDTARSTDHPGPPPDSPPPMSTALSGAEGASLSPVLRLSEHGPRSHVPSESCGKLAVRLAFGRSVGAIRFGFLAVVTGLAILLEPFTENERDESNDRSDSDS